MSSSEHSAPAYPIPGSVVRILVPLHRNTLAQVLAVGDCGHSGHELLHLRLISGPRTGETCWLPTWTVEVQSLALGTRQCRFRALQPVRVSTTAMARHGQVGVIVSVTIDPPGDGLIGGILPMLHARYAVRFTDGSGFDAEQHDLVFWDHELSAV